jgi:hypothetical protein
MRSGGNPGLLGEFREGCGEPGAIVVADDGGGDEDEERKRAG